MNPIDKSLNTFIQQHTEEIIPLCQKLNLAYWQAAVTGDMKHYSAYSDLEFSLRRIYNQTDEYQFLKNYRDGKIPENPERSRELNLLFNAYLQNQGDVDLLKQIVHLGTRIEQTFSAYQPELDGKPVTVNTLNELMKREKRNEVREKIWKASMAVGGVVADNLIELVRLRSRNAKSLGFDSYHSLVLHTNELDVDQIDALFQQLYKETEPYFLSMKKELDVKLRQKYCPETDRLMPWHYHDPFFQEAPNISGFNRDLLFRDRDIEQIAQSYFNSIGLPVDEILNRSDLYEGPGKNPHAFCTDIDREGDIRILCNLKNNARWMETLMHELGHAVYDKQLDSDLPWLLRQPAHILITEAVAMYFGRLSREASWLQSQLNISDEDRCRIEREHREFTRMKQLIFSRWAMVMFYFEKELYSNPDQDLNRLWWDLKAKYQHLNKPKDRDRPDWASKIHFTLAPCYYHNYLLGELLASQLRHIIRIRPRIGDYFKMNVFRPGALSHWNELIINATGEPLNPVYFIQECS